MLGYFDLILWGVRNLRHCFDLIGRRLRNRLVDLHVATSECLELLKKFIFAQYFAKHGDFLVFQSLLFFNVLRDGFEILQGSLGPELLEQGIAILQGLHDINVGLRRFNTSNDLVE